MTGALIFMKPALVPLVFSFFLYGIISSLTRWTSKTFKMNKSISMFVVFVVLALMTYKTIGLILDSVVLLAMNVTQYKDQVIDLLRLQVSRIPIDSVHTELENYLNQIWHMPYFSYATSITSNVFMIIGNLFLIFTFLFFFLLGERTAELKNPMLISILEKVTAYVSIKFFTSLLSGLLVGILLFIFDINMFVLFGFFTIILNFIPNVGATIATVIPIPIILFQYGTSWELFFLIGMMTIIHIVIGYLIDPKILGESLDLHPVTILVFLIFWGLVWGLPGLFLAVPITCILKIVLSRIDNTKTISEILGGRLPK